MRTRIVAILLAAFALPVFLFPTLHEVHPYYTLENGIFFLAAVAAILSALPERTKVIATMGVMALQAITFETVYRPMLAADDGARNAGAFIEAHTKPDDVLLIYGAEWNPEIPYYSRRKGIMCTTLASIATCESVAKTVHVGAVVDCREGPCRVRFIPK